MVFGYREGPQLIKDSDKDWWVNSIKTERKALGSPADYANAFLKKMAIGDSMIRDDVEFLLVNARDLIYQDYLIDEARLNASLMNSLFRSEIPYVRQQISASLSGISTSPTTFTRDDLESTVISGLADISGACFEFIQILSTSNTNARRARAGGTFEFLFARALSAFQIPYQDQNSLGSKFYHVNNIGKKVDFVVPSAEHYIKSRNDCYIISTKTSLRERWQEVVEELKRSNVPHIYLATLGEDVTTSVLEIMDSYNITLVVPKLIREKFASSNNIIEFQSLLSKLRKSFVAA
jgi:hypothetical protein